MDKKILENTKIHKYFMKEALKQAKISLKKGEVPIGAIIVKNDRIISKGHNQVIMKNDPTAHAEIITIKKATKVLKNYRLNDTILYSTVEPCLMCSGAILQARIKELVYGVDEPKFGASKYIKNSVKITKGILKEECKKILQDFFRQKR